MATKSIRHLRAYRDLGESKANVVTKFIEMLVLPLSDRIGHLMVHILSIDDKVFVYVEDEVPRFREVDCLIAKNIEVGAKVCLAFCKLIRDVVNNMAELLSRMQHFVEGLMFELINESTKTLPQVLRIAEALSRMRNLSLYGASQETLEDFAHSEEGKVDIGTLHRLKVVHLLIFLMIDLVNKLLPVVVKVKEKLFVVNHLCLSVQDHGGGLSEMLA